MHANEKTQSNLWHKFTANFAVWPLTFSVPLLLPI